MLKVGVIGYSGDIEKSPVSSLVEICETLGAEIARRGHVLVTGGRDGIMEAVSKGASEQGGFVIGILPKGDPGNRYLDVGFDTGMDYGMRSVMIMYNVDVVVSIGGNVGTGLELFSAYANSKPVILLRGTGGWTDRITKVLIDGKYLDTRELVEIKSAWGVDEAMDMIKELEVSK